MRAIHSRLDPQPLIYDLWADRLVSLSVRETLRPLASAGVDAEIQKRLSASGSLDPVLDAALYGRATYPGVIIRTRHTEAALQEAVGAACANT